MNAFADTVSPERIVYKQTGGKSLILDVFAPTQRKTSGPGACALLFHGGGFERGSPVSVHPMSQAIASQGVTAIAVEYRLIRRANGASEEPLLDAKSAMRWVRANADRLGCAPDRIAAIGLSAGGTLALLTAMKTEFDDPKDDLAVSTLPNALVLFNPGVNLVDGRDGEGPLAFRMKVSPLHLLEQSKLPPTLIMHGTSDKVSPFEQVQAFKNKATSLGNADVTLIPYTGRGHGFFRKDRRDGEDFESTMKTTAEFFKRLGWI